MKKIISLVLTLIISFTLSACNSNTNEEELNDFPIPSIEEGEDNSDLIEISHIDIFHLEPSYNALNSIGELNGFQAYDKYFQSQLVKGNLHVDLILKSTMNYPISFEFIITVTDDEEIVRNDLLFILANIFSNTDLITRFGEESEQMIDETIELIGDSEANLDLVIHDNSFAYVVEGGNLHIQINDYSFTGDNLFELNSDLVEMGMEAGLHLFSYSFQYRAQEQIMNIVVQTSPSLDLHYTIYMHRENSIDQAEESLNTISEFLPEKVSEHIPDIADAFRDLRWPWNSEIDIDGEIIVDSINQNQSDYFAISWSEPLDFSYLD